MSTKKKKTRTATPPATPTSTPPPSTAPTLPLGAVETRIALWVSVFEKTDGTFLATYSDGTPLFTRRPGWATYTARTVALSMWAQIVTMVADRSFSTTPTLVSAPPTVTLSFHDRVGRRLGTLEIPIFPLPPGHADDPVVRAARACMAQGAAFYPSPTMVGKAQFFPSPGMSAPSSDEASLDRAAIVQYLNMRATKLTTLSGPGRGSPNERAIRLIQADVLRDAARVVQEGRYLP